MYSVFLLGATGYLGGSLLVTLKKAYPELDIKALVRSPANMDAVKAAGATPIHGTFTDTDLIADLSADADIVVDAGDCDAIVPMTAILRGMQRRKASGKKIGILIHTSGTGLFLVGKDGIADPGGRVWDDNNEDDIRSLTTSMWHGQVDVPILKADEEGYIYNYTLCPSVVHGPGFGPVNRASLFFKIIVGEALKRTRVAYVGEGNIIGTVHIDDVMSLYLLIFKLATSGPPTSSAYGRFFICSSTSPTMHSILVSVAEALYRKGKIDSAELQKITFEDAEPLGLLLAGNSKTKSDRSRALGWAPGGLSIFDNVADDVDLVFEEISA